MKNIILFSATLLVLSGFCLHAAPAEGQILIDIEQVKTGTPVQSNTKADHSKTENGTAPKPATEVDEAQPIDVTPNGETKDSTFTTDHELAKQIYQAIRDDRIFTTDSKIKIQVRVYNGKVTLSGDVTSSAEKQRAELLANQANKLRGVTNNIRVIK